MNIITIVPIVIILTKMLLKKKERFFSKTPEETFKLMSEKSKRNWKNPEYLAKNPCGSIEDRFHTRFWHKNGKSLRRWSSYYTFKWYHKMVFIWKPTY